MPGTLLTQQECSVDYGGGMAACGAVEDVDELLGRAPVDTRVSTDVIGKFLPEVEEKCQWNAVAAQPATAPRPANPQNRSELSSGRGFRELGSASVTLHLAVTTPSVRLLATARDESPVNRAADCGGAVISPVNRPSYSGRTVVQQNYVAGY
ncbi:hypothetical protein J6590_015416 [Homalodisca vitripennis]|nr:hypothetical protein J6590_015416 [Homalodisca vitripennis]